VQFRRNRGSRPDYGRGEALFPSTKKKTLFYYWGKEGNQRKQRIPQKRNRRSRRKSFSSEEEGIINIMREKRRREIGKRSLLKSRRDPREFPHRCANAKKLGRLQNVRKEKTQLHLSLGGEGKPRSLLMAEEGKPPRPLEGRRKTPSSPLIFLTEERDGGKGVQTSS